MGSIGIPYLKAIGIRIHAVRFQKKLKDLASAVGSTTYRSSRSTRSADSKSKETDVRGKGVVLLVLSFYSLHETTKNRFVIIGYLLMIPSA